MSFELTDTSVVLDGNDFDALAEATTGKHYFAERIGIDGIFDYGFVAQGNEVQISLADNGINNPLIIDRVVALAKNGTADEVVFTLYRKVGRGLQEIGKQRFSNGQMPVDYPDGIIFPDMVLGVKLTRADATITVYVKPVKILSGGIAIFLSCTGVRIVKAPALALRVANIQLITGSSADKLDKLASQLNEKAQIIKQKDEAYEQLEITYQSYLTNETGGIELDQAFDAFEELPEVEDTEDIQTEIEQIESELSEITTDLDY